MNKDIYTFNTNIEPVCFGKAVLYEVTGDIFIEPQETQPTVGKHDFKTCDNCKIELITITESAKKLYDKFPYCCPYHSNLTKLKWFNKAAFGIKNIPQLLALKYVYTKQHIINCIDSDDWFEDIKDYIDYTTSSFGQFPKNCGEPLLLSHYIEYVKRFVKSQKPKDLPDHKRKKILDYLES